MGPSGFTITGQNLHILGTGLKAVTTSGSPLAMVATSVPCAFVCVQALETNTHNVLIGGPASTDVAASTHKGIELEPGKTFVFPATNLQGIYVDCVTNGEGVSYTYFG